MFERWTIFSFLLFVLAFLASFTYPQSVRALTCGFGSDIGGGCRGYLTDTAQTTWEVPADWNSASNTVEVIGGGAGGDGYWLTGGGGGGYSRVSNLSLTPGANITYQVGEGGAGKVGCGACANNPGEDTWFNGASYGVSSVGAKGGGVPSGGTGWRSLGGQSGEGIGDVRYSGGRGHVSTSGLGGSGGGSAAHPARSGFSGGSSAESSGAGGGGTNSTGDDVNGSASGGYGGLGGAGSTAGGIPPGGDGINGGGGAGGHGNSAADLSERHGGDGGTYNFWASGYGPGGGGGGGGGRSSGGPPYGIGGDGALYGGGGGAGGGNGYGDASNETGGNGAQGIIVITYTPPIVAPTITTSSAHSVVPTTATLFGSLTDTGGETGSGTQHGFARGTNASLSSGVSTTTEGEYAGAGIFSSALSGLSEDTTYYFRAYATNSAGTGYGSIQSFITGNSTPARTIRLLGGFSIKFFSGRINLF